MMKKPSFMEDSGLANSAAARRQGYAITRQGQSAAERGSAATCALLAAAALKRKDCSADRTRPGTKTPWTEKTLDGKDLGRKRPGTKKTWDEKTWENLGRKS
jgi:hypothetical protein